MKMLVKGAIAMTLAFTGPAHADVLVDNVNGYTIDENGELDQFVALWIDDDGKIKQVFDRGEDLPKRTDFRFDGQGQTLLPGLIDSHAHVIEIGLAEMTLDLSQTESLDQALGEIEKFARENPSRPWILGTGWNHEKWGLGRFPTAAELDAIVADRPIWLERVDAHAIWANSVALSRAGISSTTKNPEGGRIERLPGTQTPSGILVDKAMALGTGAIPAPRPAELDLALAKAQELLLSYGITAVADMGTSLEEWMTFRRAGDLDSLRMRVMVYAQDPDLFETIGGVGERPWLYNDRLRLTGVKLFLDGAMGSRGAWLSEPYADDPGNRGIPAISPTRLRNLISRAALGNYPVAAHAIGDAANAEVISAIEELSESFPGDRRWRIEHVQILDPADIDRLGKSEIIASMQPLHQTSDRLMAERRLEPARLDGAYAWRSIIDAGGLIAFGSDAPVENPDPWAGIAAAISRTDDRGEPAGGWYPAQSVSLVEALQSFTANAAFAGFADGRFGRLVPGERADFVLIDRDPFTSSIQELRNTRVLQTWLDGTVAWQKAE
ncbi:amidohydrolase [Altererythrobacter sp. MF3-039]|uniref:amidohydrolase n=1 Tax=Altererythrobacter sp. MF3-039 TaxID=3252901 RepID=UPI00390C6935